MLYGRNGKASSIANGAYIEQTLPILAIGVPVRSRPVKINDLFGRVSRLLPAL